MSAIAFVGDSFCAAYDIREWENQGFQNHQHGATQPTHISHVVKTNNYKLFPYGFGGKSWWFSRQRFLNDLDMIPADRFRDQLEVIVFFHTNPHRINNYWNNHLDNTSESSKITKNYYKHIFDPDFNIWAQQRWFDEINRTWGHLKTIHFHCFPDSVQWTNLLPGVQFLTPLIYISVGELTGSDKDIDRSIQHETRDNHLSVHNNIALGNIILRSINDYRPGQYHLPIEDFEIINQNYSCWPDPGYGTQ